MITSEILTSIEDLSQEIYKINVANGWWEESRNDGECIALMHSELSEGLEAIRHGNPPSDHIPQFSGLEEEMADEIIRVLDYAKGKNLRIGPAILAKLEYNRGRGYKHGGKKI